MNNEMTFNLHQMAGNRAQEMMKKCVEKMSTPLRWLRGYYSDMTGRRLTMRQTWSLIEAQTAFFLGIMPADLLGLDRNGWQRLVDIACSFAAEACRSTENYISRDFAQTVAKNI